MWYVEVIESWTNQQVQIWECLTRQQSREIHRQFSQSGAAMVRSGVMQ
jgi:hypothetical protein